MKRETLFLKLALFAIGLPILALSVTGLVWLVYNPVNPVYGYIMYPILIGIYVSGIPFYIALYNAFKLLGYIDKSIAFSELSVKALRNIKHCAITFSTLYVAMMPFLYLFAEKDDAPGIIIFGMVPVFMGMIIAVFAALLQKLLANAIEIKSENDLTV